MNNYANLDKKQEWILDPETVKKMYVSQVGMLNSGDEFIRAFQILNKYPKRVALFGSARDLASNELLKQRATELTHKLGDLGYATVTGGGNGIMGAANKGAFDAKSGSIGFNIVLPHEQHPNAFTTDELSFKHFFTRKVALAFFCRGYIYFPGGFGTMDELFEVLTLIQTGKMSPVPVVLFGKQFWSGLVDFINSTLLKDGYISEKDPKIFLVTDDIDEAIHHINASDEIGAIGMRAGKEAVAKQNQ